ncbi:MULTISPECIES: RT0821/Lpp0805 family surface protein [unclassified Thalassospira]|jgi:surface antigen|uniref:RT0821/Lpp0805 family surface protein n=1 Tax=unclassified Thalassospira TaxID=2648997 RepID=UPI0007A5DAAC|nr:MULTISPECIES: RT0821/Lpp0805 family surface protein [unclassified Thalassospira]KZD02365.1 hypothetical protein AUQ41_02705 [Thalassospira sp. MCCC 1A02898]ONH89073.1 hypothetical protein TH47_03975 [Thalassospira sp. MCCC 1A02803]
MMKRIILLVAAFGLTLPFAAPAPVKADPPSWAPAHGYRAKQHKGHKRNYSRHGNELFVSDGGFLRCNRDVVGAIIGGGTGAVLGSTIGKGSGRDAAMIGGAILGMLSGYSIGQSLDQGDLACTGYALQRAPDGQAVRWQNPDSQHSYNVVPTNSWQNADGRYCREYSATARIGGELRKTYGTACRQADGSWQIVS